MAEVASDTYCTPPEVLDPVAVMWPGGIDLDPFWDPECIVEARERFDFRAGANGYRDPWGRARTVFVNGPYSSDHPKQTAKRCASMADPRREILNLCPAAPGSDYWRGLVWPWANAVAWLGRLSFRAGRRMVLGGGKVVEPGQLVHGNRTEIALVYHGHDPYRFRSVFSKWEVTVLRSDVRRMGS